MTSWFWKLNENCSLSTGPDTPPTAQFFFKHLLYVHILIYIFDIILVLSRMVLPIIETRIPLFIPLSMEKISWKNLVFLSSKVYIKNGVKIVDIS